MNTLSLAVTDSATMLRRNLRHAQRYPSMTVGLVAVPLIFLLLFRFVLGGTLGAGLAGVRYVDYLAPGIILMTVTGTTVATAVAVCSDMTEGIINRFRTMAISRASVLTGHVLSSVLQTQVSVVFVVGVALLVGFRPTADPVSWLAVLGMIALLSLALTWIAVACGLLSKNPEGASNIVLPLTLLPFISSTFVPTESMSAGVRAFAEYQPFTPITETLRALLLGTPVGDNAVIAIAWCLALTVLGYLWAKHLFNRPL